MDTKRAADAEGDQSTGQKALRDWFETTFPLGPTPIQARARTAIEQGRNVLLIAPTGSGKTLAAFLPVMEKLFADSASETFRRGVRCVYVSPMKSLAADVRKNLGVPVAAVANALGLKESPLSIGIRTGDTTASQRSKLRKLPPDVLVTTPESLSILLSQKHWIDAFRSVETIVVDEIHALAQSRRGSDLALSLERLSAAAAIDPLRIGLSATCRPADEVGRFLVGAFRCVEVVDVTAETDDDRSGSISLTVESLIRSDESAYRPLIHQRLIDRLKSALDSNCTTVVFANTRPLTERVTFLMKEELRDSDDIDRIAAHHGSLDATVRHRVEEELKSGGLGMVVTSTSLELGVDYPSADYVVQIGTPGSVARCLQRLGRGGHAPGQQRRGVILAGHAGELATAVVTAEESMHFRIEPISIPTQPLDVLCQHLVGQACAGITSIDHFFDLVCRSWPFRDLSRSDFDACLNYLCGDLPAPAGAAESEDGQALRWTSPRLRKSGDQFSLSRGRVARWFRMNVGTIDSEESHAVEADGVRIGHLESVYADRLEPGDRFVLDGRALSVRRITTGIVEAKPASGEAYFPVWTSDRPGLSGPLALALARFRVELGRQIGIGERSAIRRLVDRYRMRQEDADCLIGLWRAQMAVSEVPTENGVLIECFPEAEGWGYAVHANLHRAAAECLGRACAARIGRILLRDVRLSVADLGFVVHAEGPLLDREEFARVFAPDHLEADVLEGLDRGDLVAQRFRRIAATGFMVLRNMEGGRPKVGGLDWVSRRLYPIVAESCPDHPLVREARRDVLESILDIDSTRNWLNRLDNYRFIRMSGLSPFAAAWLEPFGDEASEPVRFESQDDVLQRLHERLFAAPIEATS
jgi:ATP-dependent Lhr-like helicase